MWLDMWSDLCFDMCLDMCLSMRSDTVLQNHYTCNGFLVVFFHTQRLSIAFMALITSFVITIKARLLGHNYIAHGHMGHNDA